MDRRSAVPGGGKGRRAPPPPPDGYDERLSPPPERGSWVRPADSLCAPGEGGC